MKYCRGFFKAAAIGFLSAGGFVGAYTVAVLFQQILPGDIGAICGAAVGTVVSGLVIVRGIEVLMPRLGF